MYEIYKDERWQEGVGTTSALEFEEKNMKMKLRQNSEEEEAPQHGLRRAQAGRNQL